MSDEEVRRMEMKSLTIEPKKFNVSKQKCARGLTSRGIKEGIFG